MEMLNLYVQGFELQVMKGMGDFIDYIYVEVNRDEL
jgi:hypothetical protein